MKIHYIVDVLFVSVVNKSDVTEYVRPDLFQMNISQLFPKRLLQFKLRRATVTLLTI